MDTNQFQYIGKSGKEYSIQIPKALSLALVAMNPWEGAWCDKKSSDDEGNDYNYFCNRPAGHIGPHLSVFHKRGVGFDQACAIWRNKGQ